MGIRIALRHRIEQHFSRPVRLSTHWLRLRPAPVTQRAVTAYSLKIDADPHFINWVRDPFENFLARLDLPEAVPRLGLDLELIADLEPQNPFDFLVEPYAANYPFAYDDQLRRELTPYLVQPTPGPRLAAWLAGLEVETGYMVRFLSLLTQQLSTALAIMPAGRPGPVDLETVFARGAGSCWEIAWLATQTLRALGLAARFVSGYRVRLDTLSSATLHAWTEVYLPGAGWVGLDPAAGLFVDENYLPLAAAPDPLRALPLVGYREACDERQSEQIEVRELAAEERPWPLTPTEQRDLLAVGHAVDTDLRAAGLQLTVQQDLGLVAAGELGDPGWTVSALGSDMRCAAERLLLCLRDQLAPGGVVQLCQGERFAGEPFPRWRLGCWARADRVPVCRDPARIGWREDAAGLSQAQAERFGWRLAQALGLANEWLVPAYEDGLYRRWQAPGGVAEQPDPALLRDPLQRRALADRLSREAALLRGYVLPLRWDAVRRCWASGAWPMRRGAIYLLPGDSPMGYRLPLGGLSLAVQRQVEPERCQFEERPLLAEVHGEVSARLSRVAPAVAPPAQADAETPEGPRTAVCLEIRDGCLYCFLPPLTHLEHYLELVAAVEAAAESLDLGVVLEGYEPPEDHRLQRFVVEPDAGALRLRLPPAVDTAQLDVVLAAAFAAASDCGLAAERPVAGGRHLTPGIGAALTLAGPRPADSPFLRRPGLLRSLIAYWHRHPSLSYLFAGRGIGPSGGAPRADEGRDEALYELELALERLPDGEPSAPWLADRVLRHLLTDPAGDMRRAEIRVDALYDPARAARRLGQVTVGSFETAPVATLATLQAVLLRALVARFARDPETGALAPWTGALHDRFMLPLVLWEDLRAVLADLEAAGYPLQTAWFEPLLARRFPLLGSVQFGDIRLELRQAHEPWPVLAEEVTAAGVARFFDASLDRVEVRAHGLTPGRHVLECNGEWVPLQPGGAVGRYVAGVRFKAAQLPATLHPTVPPVGALVFDLIDTWNGRVIGGFTYYPAQPEVVHPVGSPAPGAAPRPGEQGEEMRALYAPAARHAGGQFVARGSGRRVAQAPVAHPDPARPFLLDLSFDD